MLDSKRMSRGTGTLVAPGIVLTALHVVADRRATPLALYPGVITLTFPGHKTIGQVHGQALDPQADWVLLACESPPPAIPVRVGRLVQSGLDWDSYGFPDSNSGDGELRAGTVEDFQAVTEGVAAFQLQSDEAVAVDGLPVKGLAGAPVMVAGWMVGHLRAVEPGGATTAGTVFACPAAVVAARHPELLSLGEVSRRRLVAPETSGRRWTRWMVLAGVLLAIVAGCFLLRARAR